jgi:hypothetical protein
MITKEYYLKLIKEASLDDEEMDEFVDYDAWIPAEPHKKLATRFNLKNTIDVTNLKKTDIEKIVKQSRCIHVGDFNIYANETFTNSSYTENLDYKIYEIKRKSLSGFPCHMETKVNVKKDRRFDDFKWRHLFRCENARDIPLSTCVDTIKWLQLITKLVIFL